MCVSAKILQISMVNKFRNQIGINVFIRYLIFTFHSCIFLHWCLVKFHPLIDFLMPSIYIFFAHPLFSLTGDIQYLILYFLFFYPFLIPSIYIFFTYPCFRLTGGIQYLVLYPLFFHPSIYIFFTHPCLRLTACIQYLVLFSILSSFGHTI